MITANNRWCEVDFLSFESIKVPKIHVLGDAIQIAPLMPKSGHMANQHAKVAAAAILNAFAGQPPNPAPVINNTCYSFITDKDVVHVGSVHQYDKEKKTFATVPGSGGLSPATVDRSRASMRSRGRGTSGPTMLALSVRRRVRPKPRRIMRAITAPGMSARVVRAAAMLAATTCYRLPASVRRRLASGVFLEHELHLLVVADVDRHLAAGDELAEQQLVGERLADRVLDEPRHRPRAHLRIEALLRQVLLERRRERGVDLLLVQLVLELEQELVDDAQDDVVVERAERDRRVEPVAELRREHPLDLAHLVAGALGLREAHRALARARPRPRWSS